MNPAITIRKAVDADASGLLECLYAAFSVYQHPYMKAGFKDTVLDLHSIHERLKEMTVLIALDEQSRIFGTIGFKPVSDVEGHIRGMAVHPEWQGRGVAWRLLEEAQKEQRKLGCYRVTLGTTKPLEQAMTFYERNGFRRSGKVGDFFGMPLIEYVKNLEDS